MLKLAHDAVDFVAHFLAQLQIERRKWLVEQQEIGLDDERAGERDALLLAAGKLLRQAVAKPSMRTMSSARPRALALGARRPCAFRGRKRRSRRRSDAETGIGLEHHADIALAAPASGDVAPAEHRSFPRRRLEAGDHAQRRRLAAARRPEQAQHLAAFGQVMLTSSHGDESSEALVD